MNIQIQRKKFKNNNIMKVKKMQILWLSTMTLFLLFGCVEAEKTFMGKHFIIIKQKEEMKRKSHLRI